MSQPLTTLSLSHLHGTSAFVAWLVLAAVLSVIVGGLAGWAERRKAEAEFRRMQQTWPVISESIWGEPTVPIEKLPGFHRKTGGKHRRN